MPSRRHVGVAAALLLAGALGACSEHSSRSASAPAAVTSTTAITSTTTMATTTTTVDPGTLPQTMDRPSDSDAAFMARMGLVWEAAVTGDTDDALPAFFPVTAYVQVKELPDPIVDWHSRLVATYDRDLATLHAGIPAGAVLVSVVVPGAAARWIVPGVEYNRIGYWRVYGTEVTYSVAGVLHEFEIQSLISWRGQWYVVHLVTPPR